MRVSLSLGLGKVGRGWMKGLGVGLGLGLGVKVELVGREGGRWLVDGDMLEGGKVRCHTSEGWKWRQSGLGAWDVGVGI